MATAPVPGDGLTDIYFTNGASLPSLEKTSPRYWSRLYRNLGGFRFQDVTEKAGVAGAGYSMGTAAANYDNHGHVDLFVAGVGGNILYHNRGDGAFEDVRSRSMWSQLTTPSSIVMPAQGAASAAAEHQRLGDEFLASRKFDQAIAEFKKALMIDANLPEAHDGLGVALVGKADVAGAVREFQEAVRLGPGDAKAKSNLGLALLSTGNTKAAVGALRAATEAEPSSPLDHYRLGLALASDRQLTPAVAESHGLGPAAGLPGGSQ